MDEVVQIFWDDWRQELRHVDELEAFLKEARAQPSCQHTPWLRAWITLFVMHCRVQNRQPVVLVRNHGELDPTFAEVVLPDRIVTQAAGMTNVARNNGRDTYDLDGTGTDYGVVATTQGAAFVWYGAATHTSGGWRSYRNQGNEVGSRVWPGHPSDRWYNMTGGKKIEFNFFEFLPRLAADARHALISLLGGTVQEGDDS